MTVPNFSGVRYDYVPSFSGVWHEQVPNFSGVCHDQVPYFSRVRHDYVPSLVEYGMTVPNVSVIWHDHSFKLFDAQGCVVL